ncbi:MAG: hypothetical protein Q7J27_10915 [Syntrophales bacterium]|nr:hypothetical protein [Syntrophales bacterium]
MRNYFVLIVLLLFVLSGCANRQLSSSGYKISSVSDTSKCEFVKNTYFEARASTIAYYAQLNTEQAGGNAYKILNVASEMAMGVNIQMVNIEIYNCPK